MTVASRSNPLSFTVDIEVSVEWELVLGLRSLGAWHRGLVATLMPDPRQKVVLVSPSSWQ